MSTSDDCCKSNNNQNQIGPELPPNFKKRHTSELETTDNFVAKTPRVDDFSVTTTSSEKPQADGFLLSSHLTSTRRNDVCGPQLPPNFKRPELEMLDDLSFRRDVEDSSATRISSDTPESYGPALPPHLRSTIRKNVSGPKLPTELVESSDDEDHYGPLPPSMVSHSKAHIALEERALQIKIDSLQKDAKAAREEWMIELPEVHSRNLGLGPRQFRAKPAPDLSDRSSWTDTPQDKANKSKDKPVKKIDLKKESELKLQKKYDKEQEKIIKEYKKHKKDESLLNIHQRNLSQKKKEEECTRRPFNREIDLKVNHFDEAQKKAILKKAQLLDDRFSSGHSKYL